MRFALALVAVVVCEAISAEYKLNLSYELFWTVCVITACLLALWQDLREVCR